MNLSTQPDYRKWLKVLGVVGTVVIVMFGAYQVYLAMHFRVVSTSPKTNNVAAVTPFLKINFNRQLTGKNLVISSRYSIVKSYKIKGKSLLISLKSPMTAGYEYSVRLNHIVDTKGEVLSNKALVFTPKNIPWQKLSKDQQAALLQAQANRPHSASDINLENINTLITLGVTSDQATSLKQDFFTFAPKAGTISIEKNSVVATPHNRNSSSTYDTINFNVKVGSKPYKARIEYSYLSGYTRLYLYDPSSGAQVFDSGAPQINE